MPRQADTDHCTTCGLLYDTQDSRSAECTVRPTVTFIGALAAFLCISFLPSKIHTRVPKNFQFRPSHISTETRLLPWDEGSREMGPVKGPPLCVPGGARLSMCALCSVRGRSDAVGHQVVPVATSRTTGCCNPATRVGICGSDSLPSLDLTSRFKMARDRGFNFLQV